MTFSAIAPAKLLGDYLDSVSTLVDECKIHCNDDGIQIRAVDPANVAMVDARLPAGAFESYEADGETLGVDLGTIEDVIGMAESGDLVRLDLNKSTLKLNIEIGTLEYTAALIDPDSIRQEPDIPDDLEMVGEAVLEGRDLKRGISAADLASDHLSMAVDADASEFIIGAEGDKDDVEYTFTSEDLIQDQFSDNGRSLFSLDYLKDMNKPMNATTEVAAELGDEMPVNLRFDLGNDGDASVRYMLAPRIQKD